MWPSRCMCHTLPWQTYLLIGGLSLGTQRFQLNHSVLKGLNLNSHAPIPNTTQIYKPAWYSLNNLVRDLSTDKKILTFSVNPQYLEIALPLTSIHHIPSPWCKALPESITHTKTILNNSYHGNTLFRAHVHIWVVLPCLWHMKLLWKHKLKANYKLNTTANIII